VQLPSCVPYEVWIPFPHNLTPSLNVWSPQDFEQNVVTIGKSFFLNTYSPDLIFPAFQSQGNIMPVIKWEYFMGDWKSN